jgi:ferredoxin
LSGHGQINIFAFPVLSWAAPVLVKRYIRRLPPGQGSKAAVFAVYAGDPVQAVQNMERLLRRKGFDIFLSGGTCYPNNWAQMMDPPGQDLCPEILSNGDSATRDFIAAFHQGEQSLYQSPWMRNVITGLVSILFSLIGRRVLGKAYIVDTHCNHCGLCVKTCPVGAIRMSHGAFQKPYWNFQCEDCGRCINLCPQRAIQVSIFRLMAHLILHITTIGISWWIAGSLVNHLPALYRFVGWGISFFSLVAVGIWVQFYLVDHLFFLIQQIPGIRKIFEWSFTKRFNRYHAPGFKPTNIQ